MPSCRDTPPTTVFEANGQPWSKGGERTGVHLSAGSPGIHSASGGLGRPSRTGEATHPPALSLGQLHCAGRRVRQATTPASARFAGTARSERRHGKSPRRCSAACFSVAMTFRFLERRADGFIRYSDRERIVVGVARVRMVGSAFTRWVLRGLVQRRAVDRQTEARGHGHEGSRDSVAGVATTVTFSPCPMNKARPTLIA